MARKQFTVRTGETISFRYLSNLEGHDHKIVYLSRILSPNGRKVFIVGINMDEGSPFFGKCTVYSEQQFFDGTVHIEKGAAQPPPWDPADVLILPQVVAGYDYVAPPMIGDRPLADDVVQMYVARGAVRIGTLALEPLVAPRATSARAK